MATAMAMANGSRKWQQQWQTATANSNGNGSGKWQWHGRICVVNQGLDVANGRRPKVQVAMAMANAKATEKWNMERANGSSKWQ